MDYRHAMLRTANLKLPRREQLANAALGLGGEAGETTELIKKHLFHGKPLDREKLVKELGDVRYYMEWLMYLTDIGMQEVEAENVKKLQERHPNGFVVPEIQTVSGHHCDHCGQALTELTASAVVTRKDGTRLHFCSEKCVMEYRGLLA